MIDNGRQVNIACIECGKKEDGIWSFELTAILELRSLCFSCNFWYEKILVKNDENVARIGGCHFIIGEMKDESYPSHMLGCGGRFFKIKFFDNRIVETNNLWYQGGIPSRFQNRLEDNAEFIT